MFIYPKFEGRREEMALLKPIVGFLFQNFPKNS